MADETQEPVPGKVTLVNPAGELVDIPADKLGEAKAKGYRAESDQEFEKRYSAQKYGGLGNELLAGGLGAARTLTFGLSDLGMTKLGIAAPATLQGLKEENPKSSLTGEVAGAVIPLLLGDVAGVGSVAKGLGKGVEGVSALGHAAKHGVSHLLGGLAEGGAAGLARKVLPMVAEGAVEGAAYGVGHEVSEAALGDHELTAEKLIAGAGMGALLGGGIQGVLGVSGAGISAMKRAAESKLEGTLGESIQSWVDEFAENSRLRSAFGQSKKALKAMDEEGAKPYLRKEALGILDEMALEKPIMSQKEITEKLTERLTKADEERSQIFSILDGNTAEHEAQRLSEHRLAGEVHATRAGAATSAVEERNAAKMAEWESSQGGSMGVRTPKPELEPLPDIPSAPMAGQTRRITTDEFIAEAKRRATAGLEPATAGNAKRAIDNLAEDIRANYGDTLSFADSARIRGGVQDKVKNWDATMPNDLRDMWRRASRGMNDFIDEKAAPILKEAGLDEAAYRAARQKEGVLFDMVKYARDRMSGNLANRSVSLTDTMAGVGVGSGLLSGGHFIAGPIGTVMGAATNKLGRVYGPSALATVAEKAAKILAAARSAARIANETDALLAEWVEGAQAVGVRVAESGGKAGERYAEKAAHHRLTAGEHAVEKTAVPITAKILDSVKFLPEDHNTTSMAADARPLPGKSSDVMEAFRARSAELTALVASPDRMVDHLAGITSQVVDASPRLAIHLGDKIMQAATYLHGVMPKPPSVANPLIRETWAPARSEVDKFARRVRVATDPRTILHDLKSGTLTKEAVETARALYPKLYESMVEAIASKLSEAPANFSYRNRAQLSLLLGEPLDASMRPGFVGAMQQQWQALPKSQGEGGGGTRVTGIDKMSGGESMQTPSQRLSQ